MKSRCERKILLHKRKNHFWSTQKYVPDTFCEKSQRQTTKQRILFKFYYYTTQILNENWIVIHKFCVKFYSVLCGFLYTQNFVYFLYKTIKNIVLKYQFFYLIMFPLK
jgi:hypothetical protein